MESDECGGLPAFHAAYPEATVLCGELAARELYGFGYQGPVEVKHCGQILENGQLKLRFIDYPSEVHLQNGLLCLDETSGILYSADLMLTYGDGAGIKKTDWPAAVAAIDAERVAAPALRTALQDVLRTLKPLFVAVGHGTCLLIEP